MSNRFLYPDNMLDFNAIKNLNKVLLKYKNSSNLPESNYAYILIKKGQELFMPNNRVQAESEWNKKNLKYLKKRAVPLFIKTKEGNVLGKEVLLTVPKDRRNIPRTVRTSIIEALNAIAVHNKTVKKVLDMISNGIEPKKKEKNSKELKTIKSFISRITNSLLRSRLLKEDSISITTVDGEPAAVLKAGNVYLRIVPGKASDFSPEKILR